MKEFMVILAAILLLMLFATQYTLQQVNDYRIGQLQLYVNVAKEKAKISGRFTADIVTELKNNILSTFKDVEEDEIIIDVTMTPKYRTVDFDERELIHYKIGVPIKNVIAGASFFGISDNENKAYYILEGATTSELIAP